MESIDLDPLQVAKQRMIPIQEGSVEDLNLHDYPTRGRSAEA